MTYTPVQHICQIFIEKDGKTVCKDCGFAPPYYNEGDKKFDSIST